MESQLSPGLLRIQPQIEDAALLPSWPELPLGDYITSFRNGFGRRPHGVEEGPIVVRLSDIADGRLDLARPRRVTMSARECTAYQLQPDDLLFVRLSKRGDQIGRCIVVDQLRSDVAFSDHLSRLPLSMRRWPSFRPSGGRNDGWVTYVAFIAARRRRLHSVISGCRAMCDCSMSRISRPMHAPFTYVIQRNFNIVAPRMYSLRAPARLGGHSAARRGHTAAR